MDKYAHYSKEDLISEIKRLKMEQAENDTLAGPNKMMVNMIALRKTISDVLSLLLNSNDEAVIDKALLHILRFFNVDRAYIGIFDEQSSIVDFTHEVTSAGIVSMREDLLRQLSADEIPWWIEQIKAGKDIIINDTAKMPPEAATEQHLLELQDILSLLVLPVSSEGKVYGFIGLDSVKRYFHWKALEIENLRVLANIVSIAIEREHAHHIMKHSANLMLKSEAKFRIIFEKLSLGVELYDINGVLLDLNEAALGIFGTTRESATGINLFENPNIPEWVHRELKDEKEVTFTTDYSFQSVKEALYYDTTVAERKKRLQITGITLRDRQGKPFGFLFIILDDTENHRKAEERRERENELIRVREADKLKSAFLANMSHEIRTPLNAIIGFSDIITETCDEEERKEYIEIIHRNSDILLNLIDDILDFSKIESGTLDYHITETNIKEICGEVCLASSLRMKPGVQLIFDKELPPIRLKTDPQRVVQVLSNFINNAIKFTEKGSITLSYREEGEYLRVSVQDTGIGISESDRQRIFDRFVKINEFKQGSGLGLTICKTIIESLNGIIGVDSVQGIGSTFWFKLPLK